MVLYQIMYSLVGRYVCVCGGGGGMCVPACVWVCLDCFGCEWRGLEVRNMSNDYTLNRYQKQSCQMFFDILFCFIVFVYFYLRHELSNCHFCLGGM